MLAIALVPSASLGSCLTGSLALGQVPSAPLPLASAPPRRARLEVMSRGQQRLGFSMERGQLKIGANLSHVSSSLPVTQKDGWVLDFDCQACYSSSLEDWEGQRAWQVSTS